MENFFATNGCSKSKQIFTGVGNCDVSEDSTNYSILTRAGASYAVPANGDFTQTIIDSLALPFDDINKMWIVGKYTANDAPEGGDLIIKDELDRGGSRTVGQKPISVMNKMPSKICLYNGLSDALNGLVCREFRIDTNNNVFGTVIGDKFAGFECSTYLINTPATSTEVEILSVKVSYSVNYFTELRKRSNLFVTEEFESLVPIYIKKVGTVTTGTGTSTATFKVITSCSNEVLDSSTAELMADVTAFIPASSTVSAVTYSSSTQLFSITVSSETMPDIKIADPTVLKVLGVFGYEGINESFKLAD